MNGPVPPTRTASAEHRRLTPMHHSLPRSAAGQRAAAPPVDAVNSAAATAPAPASASTTTTCRTSTSTSGASWRSATTSRTGSTSTSSTAVDAREQFARPPPSAPFASSMAMSTAKAIPTTTTTTPTRPSTAPALAATPRPTPPPSIAPGVTATRSTVAPATTAKPSASPPSQPPLMQPPPVLSAAAASAMAPAAAALNSAVQALQRAPAATAAAAAAATPAVPAPTVRPIARSRAVSTASRPRRPSEPPSRTSMAASAATSPPPRPVPAPAPAMPAASASASASTASAGWVPPSPVRTLPRPGTAAGAALAAAAPRPGQPLSWEDALARIAVPLRALNAMVSQTGNMPIAGDKLLVTAQDLDGHIRTLAHSAVGHPAGAAVLATTSELRNARRRMLQRVEQLVATFRCNGGTVFEPRSPTALQHGMAQDIEDVSAAVYRFSHVAQRLKVALVQPGTPPPAPTPPRDPHDALGDELIDIDLESSAGCDSSIDLETPSALTALEAVRGSGAAVLPTLAAPVAASATLTPAASPAPSTASLASSASAASARRTAAAQASPPSKPAKPSKPPRPRVPTRMVPVHQQADAALRQIHGILMGLRAQLIGPAEERQDPQLPPAIDRLVGALRGLLALVETVRDPASRTVGADGRAAADHHLDVHNIALTLSALSHAATTATADASRIASYTHMTLVLDKAVQAVTALVGALHTDMAVPRPAAPIPSHARSSQAQQPQQQQQQQPQQQPSLQPATMMTTTTMRQPPSSMPSMSQSLTPSAPGRPVVKYPPAQFHPTHATSRTLPRPALVSSQASSHTKTPTQAQTQHGGTLPRGRATAVPPPSQPALSGPARLPSPPTPQGLSPPHNKDAAPLADAAAAEAASSRSLRISTHWTTRDLTPPPPRPRPPDGTLPRPSERRPSVPITAEPTPPPLVPGPTLPAVAADAAVPDAASTAAAPSGQPMRARTLTRPRANTLATPHSTIPSLPLGTATYHASAMQEGPPPSARLDVICEMPVAVTVAGPFEPSAPAARPPSPAEDRDDGSRGDDAARGDEDDSDDDAAASVLASWHERARRSSASASKLQKLLGVDLSPAGMIATAPAAGQGGADGLLGSPAVPPQSRRGSSGAFSFSALSLASGSGGHAAPGNTSTPVLPMTGVWASDDGQGDLILTMEGAVRGGTLEALVKRLTPHAPLNGPEFLQAFLLTHRTFVTRTHLVRMLIQRFWDPMRPAARAELEALAEAGSPLVTPAAWARWSHAVRDPIRLRVLHVLQQCLNTYRPGETSPDDVAALTHVTAFANALQADPATHRSGTALARAACEAHARAHTAVTRSYRSLSASTAGTTPATGAGAAEAAEAASASASALSASASSPPAPAPPPPASSASASARKSLTSALSGGSLAALSASLTTSSTTSSTSSSSSSSSSSNSSNSSSSSSSSSSHHPHASHLGLSASALPDVMRRHASWRPRPLQRVTDLEPSDVARQLTVGEYKVFARCRSTDLLKQTNPKMAMSGDVLRVKALSERSNGIVAWIAATVLAEAEVKRRAELLRFFIKVAQTLRGLNNFNTLQSVLAGLDAVAIHRLRRSWDAVPSRTLATWTALKEGMSPARNFAAYRDAFEAAATPRIPFMGRTLTDLRFAEDGNPNFLDAERTVINFSKRMLQASILSRVEQSRIAYAIDVNPTVQQWLSTQCETAHRTWDSQTQYDVSCRLEPRESHPTPASLATSGVSRATTTAGSASSPPGQPSVRASS